MKYLYDEDEVIIGFDLEGADLEEALEFTEEYGWRDLRFSIAMVVGDLANGVDVPYGQAENEYQKIARKFGYKSTGTISNYATITGTYGATNRSRKYTLNEYTAANTNDENTAVKLLKWWKENDIEEEKIRSISKRLRSEVAEGRSPDELMGILNALIEDEKDNPEFVHLKQKTSTVTAVYEVRMEDLINNPEKIYEVAQVISAKIAEELSGQYDLVGDFPVRFNGNADFMLSPDQLNRLLAIEKEKGG